MKKIGCFILSLGVVFLLLSINMDTTVTMINGSKINNIGLISSKQNYILVSLFMILLGLIVALYGKSNRFNRQVKKCPFCAEDINLDAIKCKHCGSDLGVTLDSETLSAIESGIIVDSSDGKKIINSEYIDKIANEFKSQMPTSKVATIMITFMPKINQLKSNYPLQMRDEFEAQLEIALKKLS